MRLERTRCALIAACVALAPAGANAQLSWEVVNRFPLLHDAAFAALAEAVGPDRRDIEARIVATDLRERVRHLDERADDGRIAWDERTQSYDASRLLAGTARIVARSSLADTNCRWIVRAEDGAVSSTTTGPCGLGPPLVVDLRRGYDLAAVGLQSGASESAKVFVQSKLVVAPGDSFASGEGNPDYPAVFRRFTRQEPQHDWATARKPGTPARRIIASPARWLDIACHRSLLGWPSLHALRDALANPHQVVQFASFACSGAEIVDGFVKPQRSPPGTIVDREDTLGQVLGKSQQEALARLLCADRVEPNIGADKAADGALGFMTCAAPCAVDRVFVQFGGNDTGFAGVVKWVFHPQDLKYKWLAMLFGPLVNSAVRSQLEPLSPREVAGRVESIRTAYAEPLMAQQRAAAKTFGWRVAESSPAFAGHGFCAGSLECDATGPKCPSGDRVRWAHGDGTTVHAANSPALLRMADFQPYDAARKRGMRYGMDALLTGARFDSRGRVALDWIFLTAHPTANAHARIASGLDRDPSTERPSASVDVAR